MRILKVPIEQVEPWEKNPRGIKAADYERLKRQILKLGVYKPLVACRENGKYIVLGGNMRIRALKELGVKEVDVSVVEAKTEKERIEYALSDNDRVAYYEEEKLFELIQPSLAKIDLATFGIDFREPKSLALAVRDYYGDDVILEPESRWETKDFAEAAKRIIAKMSFPYRTLSDYDLVKDFADLCWTNAKISNAGLKICNELQPAIWQTRSGSGRLLLSEIWDARKEELISYLLERRGEIAESLYQIRNLLCLLKSVQRAWVFRPALARCYDRRFSRPGDLIIDPSAGWGSRMLGYLSLGRKEQFIGIDPSREAIEGNRRILEFLKIDSKAVRLIEEPFEDWHGSELYGKIGFIITSPPYFDTEEYAGEKQSFRRYPTLDRWKEWLRSYIAKCAMLLRPGARFVLNVGPVGKERVDISADIKKYLLSSNLEIERIDTEIVSRLISSDLAEQQRGEPFYIAAKRASKRGKTGTK